MVGSLSKSDETLLKRLYTRGPAAYGSVANLQKHSRLSRKKVLEFLHSSETYTKYRHTQRKFPRLKVIAFDINEVWSVDLAFVDKLAPYNKGVKYLMVAVDVLSRFVRVEPMENKFSTTAASAFSKMIKKRRGTVAAAAAVVPKKVWTDKGTEFLGAFKKFCNEKGIDTYTTESETKSAFAERNIRSLKNIMYKYMEEKNTFNYLPHLNEFVNTINTRVNRVTKLAPAKVVKKHVAHLVSLTIPTMPAKKPKLRHGDFVRIAKEDIPFRKGYRPHFTNETFQVTGVPTLNPPTYNIRDENGQVILGKFYESELVKVIKRVV